MIIIYLGGIGSGKTVSAVRHVIENPMTYYMNFNMKNTKDCHRIKVADIINSEKEKLPENSKRKPRVINSVNWKFWEKARQKGNFSIVLDEVHNLVHSRRSMSKTNILMSKWISQIRKILADKEDSHLILISQKIRKIDVDMRELANLIIECSSIRIGKRTWIRQNFYSSIEAYEYGMKMKSKFIFRANPYFRYYDTLDLVTFEDSEEFI